MPYAKTALVDQVSMNLGQVTKEPGEGPGDKGPGLSNQVLLVHLCLEDSGDVAKTLVSPRAMCVLGTVVTSGSRSLAFRVSSGLPRL